MAGAATTLVTGASAGARERAIAALLAHAMPAPPAAGASTSVPSSPSAAAPSPAHGAADFAAHSAADSAALPAAAPGAGASAVILEGLGVAATPLESGPGLQVVRIAPGCLCCDGNLVLRVTLNRLLRQRPRRLFIGLASSEHLDQLRSWLAAPPYDQLLALNPVVDAAT